MEIVTKCHNCLKTSLFLALHSPSFLAALLPSLLPYFLPSILLYQAVQEYQAQIASVAGQVLEQYQQLFGPAFLPGEKPLDPTSQEQRKTKLLGELNYSGKYFAFKEQIKVRKGWVAFIRHQKKMTETGREYLNLRNSCFCFPLQNLLLHCALLNRPQV